MTKINFKQPKYIFPLVVFVPLYFLVYSLMRTFNVGGEEETKVATDRINTELPQANAEEAGNKLFEMSRRFGDNDAFTAVSSIGGEAKKMSLRSMATPKRSLTVSMLPRLSVFVSNRNSKNWNVHSPSRVVTSIPTHMEVPMILQMPTVMIHVASMHGKWRKYSVEATSGRKPSRPDWVSASRIRRKLLGSSVSTPSPRQWR